MLVKDAIKHLQGYDENSTIALIIWQADDVEYQAKDRGKPIPSREDCNKIVDQLESNHDACHGVTWDTIDYYIDELEEK